jgi:hypothetical protein
MAKGGRREGAGRKSKAEELGIKEKLAPMEPVFLKVLAEQIKEGNSVALKMFAEYYYGKPKETMDLNLPEGVNIVFRKA